MPSTVTVTGTVGPGSSVTALVISNVTFFSVDTVNEMLTVVADGKTTSYNITAATTITCTVSGNNYTLTVS